MNKAAIAATTVLAAAAGVGVGVVAYNTLNPQRTSVVAGDTAGSSGGPTTPGGTGTTPPAGGSTSSSGTSGTSGTSIGTTGTTGATTATTSPGATSSTSSAAAADKLVVGNVMGAPSMKAFGITGYDLQGPYPGDGQGPVAACQQGTMASLGAATVVTVAIDGTVGHEGRIGQVAGEFSTSAQAQVAEKKLINWVETCKTWAPGAIFASPVPENRTDIPTPVGVTGTITWWHVGGTDHEAGPIDASIGVVRVGKRVTLYSSSYPSLLTPTGRVTLGQRAATVLAS